MKAHTIIYLKAFGYSVADFVPCELCGKRCVDVHHIHARGMGGSSNEEEYNKIENLMGLCREEHIEYGDKSQHMAMLIQKHLEFMEMNGLKIDYGYHDRNNASGDESFPEEQL